MEEMVLEFKESFNTYEDFQKTLWEKYHLDLELDEESDYDENLFYNSDLRSWCGFMEELGVIRLFPEYYRLGWEDSYYKRLIGDTITLEIKTS